MEFRKIGIRAGIVRCELLAPGAYGSMSDETTCPTTGTIFDWVRDPSNRSAWETFAVRYRERIRSWSRRNGLREPDAEDLAQGIVLLMRDRINSYDREKGRFRDWLRTVTRNACMDFFRQAEKRRCQPLLDDLPVREDLERELDDQARTEVLRIALEQVRSSVPPRDWRIFEEMTFRKRPAAELAQEHGIGKTAVYMVKHRVREKVKASVLELGGADDTMGLPDE
jgi:RNA polymerase sigma-70 factor (ECF subfamily)